MGTFSKVNRFREAGEEANVKNVEKFGTPARSLFTSTAVFSIHRRTDITDAAGQTVYQSNTKVVSAHDKTDITDAAGKQVAHIERKLVSVHRRHTVTMADGKSFELSAELFHLVKDVMNIDALGWQLRGNVMGLNFELYDNSNSIVAVISQKMASIHDKYCVDIYKPEFEREVVALLITLQHMIRDRQASSSNTVSFSSGN